MSWKGLPEGDKEYLPMLHEGNPPFIHLKTLSEEWGNALYVKTDEVNDKKMIAAHRKIAASEGVVHI